MSEGQPVTITSSPYSDVKRGDRGRLVTVEHYCHHSARLELPPEVRRCCNNQHAALRVNFSGGRSRLFREYEVAG